MKSKWIEHNGKKILYQDFKHFSLTQMRSKKSWDKLK